MTGNRKKHATEGERFFGRCMECLQSGLSEIEEQRLHQRAEKARELILGACRTVKRVIGRSRDKETIS
jgi:hypothetical protein